MKYTKGQWRLEDLEIVSGYIPEQDHIASIDECTDNYEANAQLIAAAPAMYEALKDFLTNANVHGDADKYNAYIDKLEQALAQAEGAIE